MGLEVCNRRGEWVGGGVLSGRMRGLRLGEEGLCYGGRGRG